MTTPLSAQLSLFPSTPVSAPSREAWWLSTPAFTCCVETDPARQITRTAPLLWRWRGQPLDRLQQWCWERWCGACHWERLPVRREDAA